MDRDIRQTALYKEVEDEFRRALEPAFGKISTATGPVASPDGRRVALTGARLDKLEGTPFTRICTVAVEGGPIETITGGPNDDRLPRWSPDGSRLAFLSDRAEKGQFQLYLLEAGRLGEAIPTPLVDGTVEYLDWSPDGARILLGVAGRGADLAGGQGSGTHATAQDELPSWIPEVDAGIADNQWRRLYLYDLASNTTRLLSRDGLNVWEAAWAGPDRIAAIVSEQPDEGAWYDSPLALIDADSGQERVLYRSAWQLGYASASPDGRCVAVIEAVCSDRFLVAGNLLLVDIDSEAVIPIQTTFDVTVSTWRDNSHLLIGGIRGFETVVAEHDAASGETRELWSTCKGTGVYYPDPSPSLASLPDGGFVLTIEAYDQYPEVVVGANGEVRPITSLAHAGADYAKSIGGRIEEVSWRARDGLEICGLLVTPDGPAPFPLIVHVHGGPVFAYRQSWGYLRLARQLVKRGYACLFPNPRGSSGRGQEFARMVYGDMYGEDAHDILAGVDAMVERGTADPSRLGVTGGSYGGLMSSWLITQTNRFAAAVPVAPVTDNYSQHWTSNIPDFDRLFLQDDPARPGGKYFTRSPIMFAGNVKTPTLLIAGLRDRCTPPGQAVEFHHALLEHGVESVLVLYPEEGHGVRQFPAAIDYTTRVLDWFLRHMPPQPVKAEGATQRETVTAGD